MAGFKERKYLMSKKLITGCLALFALAAFILPASASAVVATEPTGTALNPTGKTCTTGLPGICITGTNTTVAKFKSGSTTLSECSKVVLTGAISKNEGGVVEGTVHTATFTGTGTEQVAGMPECTSSVFGNLTPTTNGGGVDENTVAAGTPWCMKSAAEDKFTVRGGACGAESRAITFVLDSTTAGECKYSRTASLEGTFTTDTTGDAVVSLAAGAATNFTKESGGVLCPTEGSLEMSFTLETDEAETKPLFFS
jgi:hypothetical protein